MSQQRTKRRNYVSAKQLGLLHEWLSGRDLAILNQVSDLRLMSSSQIAAVHFSLNEHDNPAAAARATQRVLARLVRENLLSRLERRVGGVRAGSAGYVYCLGSIGQRLMAPGGPRQRDWEPGLKFLDHTLAVSQLVVDVIEASRAGDLQILQSQPEPHCHRMFSGPGSPVVLRPDLFLAVGLGDMEHRSFIEVDRGSESLPVVIGKCRAYDAYYQSGREQEAHGVFPKVCWIVPDERRADRIERAIKKDRRLTDQLFAVTTYGKAVDLLAGGTA
jgi:hypothetical protein